MKDPEFSQAFNRDEVADESVGNEVSSDAAEGQGDGTAAAVVIDPKTAVADAAADAGIDTEGAAADASGAVAEAMPGEEVGEQQSPEEIQRQKSWEGRLRKREEELAAREAALGNGGGNAEAEAGPDDAEIAELKQRLAEDFGDDFVGMISKIVAHETRKATTSGLDERLAPIHKTIEQAIKDVTDAFEDMHFSAIADVHANYREIIDSPEFQEYIGGLSGDVQEKALAVLDNGKSRDVVALLNDYKAVLEQKSDELGPDASVDEALDALEGVRGSSPVQLPERVPVGDDDEYKSAWDAM